MLSSHRSHLGLNLSGMTEAGSTACAASSCGGFHDTTPPVREGRSHDVVRSGSITAFIGCTAPDMEHNPAVYRPRLSHSPTESSSTMQGAKKNARNAHSQCKRLFEYLHIFKKATLKTPVNQAATKSTEARTGITWYFPTPAYMSRNPQKSGPKHVKTLTPTGPFQRNPRRHYNTIPRASEPQKA